LNWSTGLSPTPGTTTLLAGSGGLEASGGSILIPHFISSAIDNGHPVILISFVQTYSHYLHILRKMGRNLQNHTPHQFVNALSTHQDFSALPAATRPHYTVTEWPAFFQWLESQEPALVIIDGLCSLLDQGHSVKEAMGFFAACQRVVEGWGSEQARFVVNLFADDEGTAEELAYAVLRRSHYALSFEALASGASSDVSGQLTAVAGHLHCQLLKESRAFKPTVLHYKVSDTTVLFFSPGQSRIVL
ncbi:Elongator subunit elp6, partial [Coemansia aciculifera]